MALQASAAYDRGLGLVTQVQDLHNELTYVTYDGFGRLTSLFKPDPNQTSTLSALPSVKVEYFLTTNPKTQPYSLLHTQTQDGSDPSVNSYRDAWAYVDGMGRTIVTLDQADPGAGDGGDFVVNGLTDYDLKGAVQRVYLAWFYSGSPTSFPLNIAAATKSSRQRYDAFGRLLERYNLDGTIALRNVYHGLSEDAYDAADLSVGPHSGTYASARKDGHGRVVSTIERIHVGMALEARETKTQYLPTGEPIVITRQRGNDTVTRWMKYDSLGRMVLNVEPNVTKNFNPDPSTDPSTMKAWRYAYDDNGDLVGTSDARGCGSNYHYDAAGRILAEDYSPCLDAQQGYSQPDFSTLNGLEVYYLYDFADPDSQNIPNFTIDSSLLRGRLVSVSDRASKTLTRFDGRGRITGIARRVAVPGTPSDDLSLRYAPRWYTQVATFDGADRPASQSTGAQVAELLGSNQQSFVTTDYTKRGTVKHVGSSYGDLVTHVYHDADGLPTQIQYGDLAQTTTDFGHDDRRRLRTVQTYRGPPADWTSPPTNYTPAPEYGSSTPSTFQLVLEDAEFTYDEVDNPVEIHDWRNPADWPAGAKPVTRKAQYDDLYRLTKIDYQYSAGDDTWVDPFDNEDTGQNTDPRRAMPSPHVSFDKRVLSQSYQYDWLGNITNSSDDAAGFYDRSLGTQSHNSAKPYQLTTATGGTSTRDGSLTVAYDDAGNMTSIALERNGPCLPSTATCSQRFMYDWDEVGRLARAKRWDLSSPGAATDPVPTTTADVELRYAYDAGDQRVLKTAVDPQQNERHTVYPFASLEVRRAQFENGDYDDTRDTEVPYLFARGVRLARLHYAEGSLPTLTSGHLHVLLELPDHLGSSAIVVDRETSEIVERSTYLAYGGAESDYRPVRWDGFREDYRFTGKEEDAEVGLGYFEKRYLSPALGRWVSADPLAIHGIDSDPNVYAYVHGRVARATDPLGLQDLVSNRPLSMSTASQNLIMRPAIARVMGLSPDFAFLRQTTFAPDGFGFTAGPTASALHVQFQGGRNSFYNPTTDTIRLGVTPLPTPVGVNPVSYQIGVEARRLFHEVGHRTLTTNPNGALGTAFRAYRAKADPAFATLKGQLDQLIDTASTRMARAGVALDPRAVQSVKTQMVEHLEQETFLYDREVASFGSSGELGSKSAFVARELNASLQQLYSSGRNSGSTDYAGGVAPSLQGDVAHAANAVAAVGDRAAGIPIFVQSQFSGIRVPMVEVPQTSNTRP